MRRCRRTKEVRLGTGWIAPNQLELDTIRGYNGFTGGLHEFHVALDSRGFLVVTVDAAGRSGAAEWERVPVADRGKAGDPNDVNNVEAQADF